ncbi:hypothetical protein TRAPUB_14344 [Trametes pubescens]|uniref:Uncharacterized protein n=1 Tax=Trametes pubescens TaxID=154538 RepID=A0A1M2VNP6_TRAPU|nr:hypothetical protein TRAPUB_14344 [Trametes pubescens]
MLAKKETAAGGRPGKARQEEYSVDPQGFVNFSCWLDRRIAPRSESRRKPIAPCSVLVRWRTYGKSACEDRALGLV